jgi:hypothetical protein
MTLRIWADLLPRSPHRGCPWLDGEALETKRIRTAYNREITYFLKSDLDRVRRAIARRLKVPKYPGLVHIEAAAKAQGVSTKTMRRAFAAYRKEKGAPSLDVARDMPAKSTDGRALPRSYVPEEFTEWFKQRRELHPDADDISVEDAAALLDRSIKAVNTLIHRGILSPKAGRILCNGGYPRKANVLSRSAVQKWQENQRAKYGPAAEQRRQKRAAEVLGALLADGEWHLRGEVVSRAVQKGVRQGLVYEAKRGLDVEIRREPLGNGKSGLGPAYWRLLHPEPPAAREIAAEQAGPLNGDGSRGERNGSPVSTLPAEPPTAPEKAAPGRPELTEREWQILDALRSMKALSFERREATADLAKKVPGVRDAASLKHPVAHLKRLGLVGTKDGAWGGVWLTAAGQRCMQELDRPS